MESLFLKIVNLSITASWLVLAVMLVRILLKKAPKGINCLLWGLVALRLICPFSIESALSLVPSAQPLPTDIIYEEKPQITSGIEQIDQVINPVLSETMAPAVGASVNPLQVWTAFFAWIWFIGVAGMLTYALISALVLKSKLATAIPLGKGIKQSEFIASPFVFGIIRPIIYLPYGVETADLAPVILHEKAHIRRRDHLWKPMAFLLLAVYWFNPLLWIAYVLLCRDIEAACDESVIREMGEEERRGYASALLNCSVHRRMIAACPVAFGEVSVKNRVKSVMNYRKPAFWIVLLAIIACIATAICFLTDPPKQDDMELAQKLKAEDIAYVELVVMPQSENQQYRFIAGDELKAVADLLNQASGKIVKRPKLLNGGCSTLHVTLKNGGHYTFSNEGNVYFRIGDVAYQAPRAWLESWEVQFEKGNEALPVNFYRDNDPKTPHHWGDVSAFYESGQSDIAFRLGEFPGYLFRWDAGQITMKTAWEEEEEVLYTGMPITSLYTCDLTGDGNPELCSSVLIGSGLIDERIVIYDIVEKALYQIADRGEYDYALSMENGKLMVEKYNYDGSEDQTLVEKAELGGYVQANWKRIDAPSQYFSGRSDDTVGIGSDAAGISIVDAFDGSDTAVGEPMSEIADITNVGTLTKASIVGGRKEYFCTDEVKLAFLEELLQTAVVEMPTKCSYGECILKLWDESGEIYCVYPATDGCNMIIAGPDFFRYGSKPAGFDNSVEFWDVFGLTPHDAVEWAIGATKKEKASYQVTAAGPAGDDFYRNCLNPKAMASDSRQHFPVLRIDTSEELEKFREIYKDSLALHQAYEEVPSFDASIGAYDDAFFAEQSLIICYVRSYSSSHRYRVGEVSCENGKYMIQVELLSTPGPITEEEAGWLLLVPVSDEMLAGCDQIDAYQLSQAELDANEQKKQDNQ